MIRLPVAQLPPPHTNHTSPTMGESVARDSSSASVQGLAIFQKSQSVAVSEEHEGREDRIAAEFCFNDEFGVDMSPIRQSAGMTVALDTPLLNYDPFAPSRAAIPDGSHPRLPSCLQQQSSQLSPLGN